MIKKWISFNESIMSDDDKLNYLKSVVDDKFLEFKESHEISKYNISGCDIEENETDIILEIYFKLPSNGDNLLKMSKFLTDIIDLMEKYKRFGLNSEYIDTECEGGNIIFRIAIWVTSEYWENINNI